MLGLACRCSRPPRQNPFRPREVARAIKVLEEHVEHRVAGALASGDPEEANVKSRELLEAVQRFAKTR
jgi:DNA-binding FadR family transcriptional regulator